jgi:ABC-type transport system involved in multi-copper enzyme maturation permease subunit
MRLALPSYPLVAKELTELASRKRLYVLRSLWAGVLGLVFMLTAFLEMRGQDLMGQGGRLLDAVFQVQAWAVVVVMPAACAGTLAQERENGSLPLLLLTPLGIWRILLEKWLSRVVVGASFLMIGMPFMAIAYVYGGFGAERLAIDTVLLVVFCMQVAALGLMVSAWSRSTTAAFIAAYLALPLVYFALPAALAWALRTYCDWVPDYDLVAICCPASCREFLPGGQVYTNMSMYSSSFPSPAGTWFTMSTVTRGMVDPWPMVVAGVTGIVAPLLLARLTVMRRAAASGPTMLRRVFHAFDRWSERGDARLGVKHKKSLPGDKPLAWRARRGRALTGVRYQVRLLLVGSVAVLLLVLVFHGTQLVVQTGLMALLCLVLLVQGAGLFAGERSDGTLDVLLTTPMSAKELLTQKLVGLRRIAAAFWILMLLGLGVEYLLQDLTLDWIPAAVDAVMLPALAMWIGIAVGLRVRQRHRAAVLALAVVLAWSLGGALVLGLLQASSQVGGMAQGPRWWWPMCSPVIHPTMVLVYSDHRGYGPAISWPSFGYGGTGWSSYGIYQPWDDDDTSAVMGWMHRYGFTPVHVVVGAVVMTWLRARCFALVEGALRRG